MRKVIWVIVGVIVILILAFVAVTTLIQIFTGAITNLIQAGILLSGALICAFVIIFIIGAIAGLSKQDK